MEIWFIKKIKGIFKKKSNPSINSIEEITNKKESIASVNELYGKYKVFLQKKYLKKSLLEMKMNCVLKLHK